MTDEQETEITTNVQISSELFAKMNYMSNLDKEIGGWLVGEIQEDCIFIEDILIPKQEVTIGSVDIDPSAGPALLKEFGTKCQKILGHWHGHCSMGVFWSSIDETNMTQIMDPREFYVFIVSSKNEHLVRIETKKPFRMSLNKVPFEIYDEKIEKLNKKLEKEIEKKVTDKVYVQPNVVTTQYDYSKNDSNYADDWQPGYQETLFDKRMNMEKKVKKEVNERVKYYHNTNKIIAEDLFLELAGDIADNFTSMVPEVVNSKAKQDRYDVEFTFTDKTQALEFMKNLKEFMNDIYLSVVDKELTNEADLSTV